MTNGDKIRTMTNEELVEFAIDMCECPTKECPYDDIWHDSDINCRACWEQWFKEEADE